MKAEIDAIRERAYRPLTVFLGHEGDDCNCASCRDDRSRREDINYLLAVIDMYRKPEIITQIAAWQSRRQGLPGGPA